MKNFLFFILTIFTISVWGQVKYSNEFLSIGVGARALSMGNSVISSSSDVTSGYWNPSGLVQIKSDWDLSLMHSEYFAGITKYDYGAGAYRYNDSLVLGFSMVRFGVDDIPNTLELIDGDGNLRYDRISSFSAADYAFIFSMAKKSTIKNLFYGANFKIIRRVAGDFASAWGFGLDVGAQYKYKNWEFGAMARDVTTTFNAWSFNTADLKDVFEMTGNEIPENSIEYTMPKLLLGAGYRKTFYKNWGLLAELGLDFSFDGKRNVPIRSNFASIDPHMGLEMDYKRIVFLRMGVNNIQQARNFFGEKETYWQPNLGLGIHFWRLTIDYAITNIGNVSTSLYTHIFSLRLAINKPEKSK